MCGLISTLFRLVFFAITSVLRIMIAIAGLAVRILLLALSLLGRLLRTLMPRRRQRGNNGVAAFRQPADPVVPSTSPLRPAAPPKPSFTPRPMRPRLRR